MPRDDAGVGEKKRVTGKGEPRHADGAQRPEQYYDGVENPPRGEDQRPFGESHPDPPWRGDEHWRHVQYKKLEALQLWAHGSSRASAAEMNGPFATE